MRDFMKYWFPVLVWMAIIYFLSSRSHFPMDLPQWFYFKDKVVHMCIFGFLAYLFLRAWLWGQLSRITLLTAGIAVIFTVLYGASDEFHQSFVPNRDPSVWDLIADMTGAILVCFSVFYFQKGKFEK